MKEKDNAFQEQDTVIWSALRQHVGRRQQKVLAGEKLQLGISEQMAPSSNPCREAEQSVSSHCCCGTSLCIPPRDMLYLRKPLAEYINRQKVNTCKELKDASLSLQFQKIFCLFIKMKNKPMPKKKKDPQIEIISYNGFVFLLYSPLKFSSLSVTAVWCPTSCAVIEWVCRGAGKSMGGMWRQEAYCYSGCENDVHSHTAWIDPLL